MTTHKLIQGDCLKVLKSFKNESIDCVVTSPPYDNLRKYKGFSFDFENTAKELFRIIKKGGVVVWVVGDATIKGSESGTSFKQALYFKEIGFNLHDTMIYKKQNYVPLTHNRYEQCFEYMFIFSKGKPKTFNPIKEKTKSFGGIKSYKYKCATVKENSSIRNSDIRSLAYNEFKIISNCWTYKIDANQSSKDKIAFQHPAIFPEDLARDHIISWTNESDVVLDCFAGSGTTMKACLNTNRNSINIEFEPEYCEIIKERCFKQQTLSENVFEFEVLE